MVDIMDGIFVLTLQDVVGLVILSVSLLWLFVLFIDNQVTKFIKWFKGKI